jgi:hypothetical protein
MRLKSLSRWLRWISAAALVLPFTVLAQTEGESAANETEVVVYKSATCGCCSGWVDYLRDNGFAVQSHDVDDLTSIKAQHGLNDPRLMSCHTAVVDGYLVEGHVPVDDIRRLLKERPDVVGITAPGMPQLSPGMFSLEPQGYDVLSFDDAGETAVYSRY